LVAAGLTLGQAEWGVFCNDTRSAVIEFQTARGLTPHGSCDEVTWHTLVEASWELGDRELVLRSPNLRGDDVAELQRQLGRLGFDPGRIDGIFGPDTAEALTEFQRNVGLPADGVCAAESVRALRRVCSRTTTGPAVTSVREYERLSHETRTLSGRRVVIGQLGGTADLVRTLGQALRLLGSTVLTIDGSDGADQASDANRFDADVYIGTAATNESASIAYYATTGFESLGGRRLAELLFAELGTVGLAVHVPVGMRLPVLRETRMPAVVVELGPPDTLGDRMPALAGAIARALARWVTSPLAAPEH
jgi:N-acetylmuramoyl-L-alanine amidase